MADHSAMISSAQTIKTTQATNGFRWLLRGPDRVLQQCFLVLETGERDWVDVPTFDENSGPSSYDTYEGEIEDWMVVA